jgi:hypothetical protein
VVVWHGERNPGAGQTVIIRPTRFSFWRRSPLTQATPLEFPVPPKPARSCCRFYKKPCCRVLEQDNFSARKRALNLWTTRPANVEVFWTPTNTSWLNLVEPWFLMLAKTALHNTNLKTTDAIAENLKSAINYLNDHPRPYRWTKTI